jgi:CHRD domain
MEGESILQRRITLITAVLAASLLLGLSVMTVSAESQRSLNVKVTMTGDQEVIGNPATCAPPAVCGDPNAVGTAKIHVVPSTDTVCAKLEWSSIDGSVWGAHIHGPATTQQTASIIVPFLMLTPGAANNLSGTDSLSGCVVSEQWADAIAADPSMFYINVHSSPAFNPGAIRAQLGS